MSRIFGIIMLLVGLVGLVFGIGGAIVVRQAADGFARSVDESLVVTSDSLDTVAETLELAKVAVGQAGDSLDTVQKAALNLSTTISDTEPMLNEVSSVATQNVPDSLEAVEQAIPDIAELASAIDDTLRVLSGFNFERRVFGIPLAFDLGIDYQPTAAIDEAILALGDGLEGVPESLRALGDDLDTTSANLQVIGENVESMAEDLERINVSVAGLEPLLDDYIDLVSQVQDGVDSAQANFRQQQAGIKFWATALFAWIAINQVVPLYLAWTLLTGGDDDDEDRLEPEEDDEPEKNDELEEDDASEKDD